MSEQPGHEFVPWVTEACISCGKPRSAHESPAETTDKCPHGWPPNFPDCCYPPEQLNAPAPEPRQIEQQFGVVIVSRHAGVVEWLRRRGITGRVVEHAYPKDLRQKIVYGILPFHLAALAKELIMIDMPLIPLERRGGDLSPEEMDQYGATLTHCVVIRVPQTAKERDE